jgi:hypothetical protein
VVIAIDTPISCNDETILHFALTPQAIICSINATTTNPTEETGSPAAIAWGETVALIIKYAEKKALVAPAGEAKREGAKAMVALNNAHEAVLDGVILPKVALERLAAAGNDMHVWAAGSALMAWTEAAIALSRLTPPD